MSLTFEARLAQRQFDVELSMGPGERVAVLAEFSRGAEVRPWAVRMAGALAAAGYTGVVGLEAWAQGDPDAALDAFEAAFAQ